MGILLGHHQDSSDFGADESYEALSVYKFMFCEGKNPNEGEDADPILENRESKGMLAVFDGMGGAGSEKYRTKKGDTHTGAYFASRIVRQLIENHFGYLIDLKKTSSINPEILKELKEFLTLDLRTRLDEFEKNPSRIKTNLRRKLPTTLASIYFFLKKKQCSYDVIWAGDSRAYLLMPEGLQQLSLDDVKTSASTDVLVELTQDSPLSNCISADSDFELRHVSFNIELPIILMVATDGCYGYVQTPAHFEQLLLQCMETSENEQEWGERISAFLKPISGDDYSMALICLGWKNFASIKKAFHERLQRINVLVNRLDDSLANINQLDSQQHGLEQARESYFAKKKEIYTEFWNSYRVVYEKRLKEV